MMTSLLSKPGRLAAVRGAPAAAAMLVVALTSATSPLPALARNIAFGFIVLSLLFAFVPKRANVRTHGGVVFGIVAVAISGYARTGLPYQIACGLFAIVVIATLRAPLVAARMRGASLASTRQEPAPRHLALAVIAIVATVVTASLLTALPPASRFAEAQVQRMAGNVMTGNDQVGFSTSIRVGSLTHMLRSDRVVMRVSGERTEYLRGAVLDRYEFRVWTSTQAKKAVPFTTDAPAESATTRIELSRAALTGRTPDPRWFLPSDACDLRTPSGHINLDPHGSAHPDPPGNAREISFRLAATSTCAAPMPPLLAPNAIDLGIIRKYDTDLARIARAWSEGAVTSQAKLEAMVKRLSHFTYSVEDRREGHDDLVMEFLERTHRGHCELFASALALLARSIGIPTRLVVGYRVDEINTFTGLAVVRDRNAHTWVDAWVDDHWQSFDPTPTSELLASTKASAWENVGEALSVGYDRSVGFFASITLLTYGIVSTVAAVVLIVVRRFMQRRRSVGQAVAQISRPLPAFETLSTALERAGWARIPSEPLERFARRVDGAGEPWSAEVAEALDRYAELRYGGIGEERTVAQRLDDLARKIAPSS